MNFKLTDEQVKRRGEFFAVCRELEKVKPPNWVGIEAMYRGDECWEFHRHCAKEFGKRGWLALAWPAEYGGMGDMMDKVMFSEARGYHGIRGMDVFGVQMLAPTILHAGNEEVKRRFLPPIASAEVMWCELWSEPDAGSDLASLTSTAIKKGNEYVINGQKIWTTGAHRADWGFGVFKTAPEAKKHHNLSFLLMDMKTPGITVRSIPYMTGNPAYNEVFFDDVHVPAENIVGQENGGWAVVNILAGFERSGIDQVMSMVRGVEELVKFCNETKRGGQPLSKDPIIRSRLAQLAIEVEAARTLAYRIADLQNQGEMALMDASAGKVFFSEIGERLAFFATDMLGHYGQVRHSKWAPLSGLWEDMYQECFVTTISMGTNEIQRNII
ncbi:MAG: hypothetical protein FJZ94_06675, partial [Chloroflexi bacterium]|nr:hypothetical protein [Chloroflexota bacterium]